MITTLKFEFAVSCQCLALDLIFFKVLVLAMIVLKLVNMCQHMEKLQKFKYIFIKSLQLGLHKRHYVKT
jgi:hypothetical protein